MHEWALLWQESSIWCSHECYSGRNWKKHGLKFQVLTTITCRKYMKLFSALLFCTLTLFQGHRRVWKKGWKVVLPALKAVWAFSHLHLVPKVLHLPYFFSRLWFSRLTSVVRTIFCFFLSRRTKQWTWSGHPPGELPHAHVCPLPLHQSAELWRWPGLPSGHEGHEVSDLFLLHAADGYWIRLCTSSVDK